jgi:hypothetical protein
VAAGGKLLGATGADVIVNVHRRPTPVIQPIGDGLFAVRAMVFAPNFKVMTYYERNSFGRHADFCLILSECNLPPGCPDCGMNPALRLSQHPSVWRSGHWRHSEPHRACAVCSCRPTRQVGQPDASLMKRLMMFKFLSAVSLFAAIAVEAHAELPVLRSHSIQNSYLRLEFVRPSESGYTQARIFARQGNNWVHVATWEPLFRLVQTTGTGDTPWEFAARSPRAAGGKGANALNSVQFTEKRRDADGVEWECRLAVALEPDLPAARLHYEWKPARDREIKLLLGPNIYVGDETTGDAKSWGLFPGLEYLYGAERSSNRRDFNPPLDDRRTPHPHKITVPLMAVTVGPDSQKPQDSKERFFTPDALKDESIAARLKVLNSPLNADYTVALLWDPLQRWDDEHAFPSARFASPNFDEGRGNHRLALFLPSAPEFVPENNDRANKPYRLPAGKAVTLDAQLVVAPGPATVALREWIRSVDGLPKPNPWPRSFQTELDICRAGFLKTLWDGKNEKWRHCIDWAPSHAPGFAALVWLDSRLAENPKARIQSHERVELVLTNILRDSGPGSLTSQANCHIMQWELPFVCGHLPEAMAGLDGFIYQLIKSQDPEGGWRYEPGNAEQAKLGRAGDSVLGTCANKAATLLRYARITGDTAALEAGEKALRFMERFRVPRGGQTWECPMYEPDILAAAYGVRACHDAYRVTGNARWLHNAVYWAESGVPFIYLWSLPDRPMMLGATIPVFGSTFYTHTWLGVPVQWCGLVYAYHVFHLAGELEQTPLSRTDSRLPLALNFSAADWKQITELITVSGMHQQFADGERIGAYPDSITKFEQRNPAFLNPEDILVNVLALKGYDPDVKTARFKTEQSEIVISSAARIKNVQAAPAGVRFQLDFFAGAVSHSLLKGVKAKEVSVNGKTLPLSSSALRREAGWWWDEPHQRLYLSVAHEQAAVRVEIK